MRKGTYYEGAAAAYGIPHPSARGGFDSENFVEHLKPVFEDCCG